MAENIVLLVLKCLILFDLIKIDYCAFTIDIILELTILLMTLNKVMLELTIHSFNINNILLQCLA